MLRTGWHIVLGISGAVALVTGAWGTKGGGLNPPRGLGTQTPTPGSKAVV
jgi:hypothetical protein